AVASTSEAFIGPPPVITYTGSNARNVQIESSSTIVVMTPRRPGSVMYQNLATAEVPSISAASYSSSGIACKPASSITMKNGNARQTFIAVTEKSAVSGLPSQVIVAPGCSRPSVASKPLTTPNG